MGTPFQSTRPVRGATTRRSRAGTLPRHFNPRAPCGARRGCPCSSQTILNFNPRAPCGARLAAFTSWGGGLAISIHAPRAGRDGREQYSIGEYVEFQSTRPVRGATQLCLSDGGVHQISIHAPRAGRDVDRAGGAAGHHISIHAPRAGRDFLRLSRGLSGGNFNPRAPCGARPPSTAFASRLSKFQSTRPVRGATRPGQRDGCGEPISIHAPRAGRDLVCWLISSPRSHFNPRAPCGARLSRSSRNCIGRYFNPRAPCGARLHGRQQRRRAIYFNPRAPCGARHDLAHNILLGWEFQSTRPVRGATQNTTEGGADVEFQSTRPVRGATRRPCRWFRRRWNFNPRAPCGARPVPSSIASRFA